MPLHLLGKKSWNVYNTANVARVRRDEAEAQAREEAEDRRLDEADAARRLAVLRGETLPAVQAVGDEEDDAGSVHRAHRTADGDPSGRPRKRRRLRGEDDTDADVRHAREDAEAGKLARERLLAKAKQDSKEVDAPLLDQNGHLQLIPAPWEEDAGGKTKAEDVRAERLKQKQQREEDLNTLRFKNAAGFNSSSQKPWYAAASAARETKVSILSDVQDKDVWGNEDPRRKEREQSRITSNDPFAAMQQAQRQLKQSEKDREKWNQSRAKELEELKRAQEKERRHKEKKHRRREREGDDGDSRDDFSLDAPTERRRERSDHDRHKERHRHRHRHHHRRSRSRSPERHKSRH